ncbi:MULTISPECIES: hypothetical protein [Stappiaceae]|jgi:hypothetical protein|uniref:NHLP leader peptide family natural product n=2 Tax=Roseibium TaxID=150830 RepID=A0A0M6XZQ3_9HYPH|nr:MULTISPECIES: hypothetical protein [Stappiaceae]MCR9282202.1 hypothetical protein [Paracoccaceae bacterium]MEC9418741.1 hypothetical protein [Pseudomonadota bacterium]AQQ06858.1 hypothetical protein B0E33_27480 [Roseibium aggregatum]MEC9472086.1 hypothetical protein [Pseudomonadota bacterium]QFT69416.1 hypothetical protein FIU93_21700 [Labrenzia sp. THAF35]
MARFPYYQSNVKDLGKLIARAAIDENFRRELERDPLAAISNIGLPKETVALMRFKIVDQKNNPNAVALPFRLNEEKLNSANEEYLKALSSTFALN